MNSPKSWKLQEAKAHFSELVRKAREGEPQHVTVRGRHGIVISDPERFDVVPKPRPRPKRNRTMAEFIEGSKKYRGLAEGIDFERGRMSVRDKRREIFDGEYGDED